MADHTDALIAETERAVEEVDAKYNAASIDEKEDLKAARDEAYTARARARRKQLAAGVVVTEQDVEDMKALRAEIEAAADEQAVIEGVGKIAMLIAGRFV